MGARRSRRSFLQGSLGASGLAVASIGVGACGSSKAAKAVAAVTTTTVPVKNGDDALARLMDGNARFASDKPLNQGRDTVRRTEQVAGQTPFAIILGCSDSRVPPEIVFDQGIGDLFLVRVAGNTASVPVVVGSIEYAAVTFDCPLLMVLGHDHCGAVKAAIDTAKTGTPPPGEIPGAVQPIQGAVAKVKGVPADAMLDAAVKQNALDTAELLRSADSLLTDRVASGKLKVVAAEYTLHTGKVTELT
jgi:carbonic anhydrase